jgi:hypothetical protein
MPTLYTDCKECNYSNVLHNVLGNNDILVINHYNNVEIEKILINKGLPNKICKQIIKMYHTLRPCIFCKTKLCDTHYNRGNHNLKYYKGVTNGAMCDKCCWWEVT